MRVVVGITGASGVVIAFRLLEELKTRNCDLRAMISHHAEGVIRHEMGEQFTKTGGIQYYQERDPDSPLNSSSFVFDAMVVVPCSMKSLAAITTGYSESLIARCAENALRTGSKLILVPRETPLSETALSNMLTMKRAGALILPPMTAYYTNPETIADVTNFFVGKILDLLNLPNDLYPRWSDRTEA
ncbi:MAG: UbiX family flavin prenyltransferase [candidate division KSB1 bacterium]|jgi:4-hydroxy-3-polyprenylbenzoate decarboxylase|nr:UbiX family flavin prenyltransferase [candidate division KSB1 bacterium]